MIGSTCGRLAGGRARSRPEEAERSGGNVIIPAFAVGRTQELLFFLNQIEDERGLNMPVYVDSPLASRAPRFPTPHRSIR